MKIKKSVKSHLKTLIGIGLVATSLTFCFLVTGTRVVVADPNLNVPPKNLIYQADQSVLGSPANLIARIIDLNKNFDAQKQRELFRLLNDSSDIFPVVFSATEKINPKFWQNWRCSGQSSNCTEIVSKIDHDRFREWVNTPQKVFDHDWKELVHDMYCDNLKAFKTHLVPVSSKTHGRSVAIDGELNQLLRFGIAVPDVVANNHCNNPVLIIDIAALMGKNNFFRYLTASEHYHCTPRTFTCALISGNLELIRNTWNQLDPVYKKDALIMGITAFAERGSLADSDQAETVSWLLNLCGEVAKNPTEASKLKAILAHTFLATSFEYHRVDSVRLVTGADKTSAQIKTLLSKETTASVAEELLKSLVNLESDQPVDTALAFLLRRNDRTSLQWLLDTLREKFPHSISDEIIKKMVVALNDNDETVLLSTLSFRPIEKLNEDAIALVFNLPGISEIIDDPDPSYYGLTFAAQCALGGTSVSENNFTSENLVISALESGADFRKIPICISDDKFSRGAVGIAKLILKYVPDKEAVIRYFCDQLAIFDHTSPKILELIAKQCGIAKFHQPLRFHLLLHYFVTCHELDNARNILVNLSHAPETMRSCLDCQDLDGKTPLALAREQVALTHDLRAIEMVALLEQCCC